MPSVFVVAFYLWLAISLVVLVSRFVGRRRRPSPMITGTAAPAAVPPPPPPAAPVAPAADVRPPAPPVAPAPASTASASAGRSTSLIDALSGIQLPCDLMPLTTAQGHDLGNRELLLITSGHDAEVVSRSLGEAMAALGFTLTSMANHDFVASRRGDRITASFHDRPEGMLAGAKAAFPTARAGDVVVELRL